MDYKLLLIVLLSYNILDNVSAAAHMHVHVEREEDGIYRQRLKEHYNEDVHHTEFDHEVILGSVKESEEFDKLAPEESKRRLTLLLPKMDLNGDQHIDRLELKKWILNSFRKLSTEEAEERLSEADENRDGVVTWKEFIYDSFGVHNEEDIGPEDTGETGLQLEEEKAMWDAADANGDGMLDYNEFEVFTNPEEHEKMHVYLVNQAMREKDTNKDGKVDFDEFIGDRGAHRDKAWLVSERERFDEEFDLDRDGSLDAREVKAWVIPNNDEIAEEEVEHLFEMSDTNRDNLLSYEEVISNYDIFVGSEAADYGNDLLGDHFSDEL